MAPYSSLTKTDVGSSPAPASYKIKTTGGSNVQIVFIMAAINRLQMVRRCKDARVKGKVLLNGYELYFAAEGAAFATIGH